MTLDPVGAFEMRIGRLRERLDMTYLLGDKEFENLTADIQRLGDEVLAAELKALRRRPR